MIADPRAIPGRVLLGHTRVAPPGMRRVSTDRRVSTVPNVVGRPLGSTHAPSEYPQSLLSRLTMQRLAWWNIAVQGRIAACFQGREFATMRRWVNVAIWTGGCLALLVVVRGLLETPPYAAARQRSQSPVDTPSPVGTPELTPPIVTVGSREGDWPSTVPAVNSLSAAEVLVAREVAPRTDMWRLPPPLSEPEEAEGQGSLPPILHAPAAAPTFDRPVAPATVDPPPVESKQADHASRLPLVEVAIPQQIDLSRDGSDDSVPTFSVEVRLPSQRQEGMQQPEPSQPEPWIPLPMQPALESNVQLSETPLVDQNESPPGAE